MTERAPAGAAVAPVEIMVHVGDGKTGSSAIQRVLREHPSQLEAQRTRFLGLMLDRWTARLFPWQHASKIEAFHRLPREQAVSELVEVLAAAVARARKEGVARLVWSNESLLGRGAATIEALRRLASDGAIVSIVAYVRRPDRWARSAYQQWGLKHKTYPGPVLGFTQWAGKRKFALAPKLRPWREAFGPRVQVRNYDATGDVTRDFLAAVGLDPAPFASVRRNEPLLPVELALRTAFNQFVPDGATPRRFTELLGAGRIDFSLPLGEWMRDLLPGAAELDAIRERCAEDIREVDAILAEGGQPAFDDERLQLDPFVLDGDSVSAALLQMVVVQAERLEALEKRVAQLADARAPAPRAVDAPPVPLRVPEGAPPAPVSQALAPALGYFGAHDLDCLSVPVDGPLSGLRLSIEEDRPVFLNLRGLELRKGGKVVAPPDGWEASQSSTSGSEAENGAGNLLRLRGIHSGAERAPWWEVRFAAPVDVDELRVTNRSDGWGSRSRTLKVEALDAGGQVRCLLEAKSPRRLAASLAEAARLAGTTPPATWPADASAAARLRETLLDAVAARLRSGAVAPDRVDWRALLPLVDAWHRHDEPLPSEWTILAAFLLHQHQGKGGTSIKAFSLLLDTRARLLRLQQELNALGAVAGRGPFMLTRHGVKAQGVLRREPARFLAHLRAVVDALRDLGRDPVLAYGTLLGAVRDGDFIAHDDDIDLIYRSPARDRAEAEADLPRLKDALRERGFRVVDLLPNSLNMHVIDARNGAVMDVFPTWTEDGRAQLHMESMRVRGIDPDILYPAGELDFLGDRFPVPARPEAFLAERYGPGWDVSDPFFEWPWPLKEEATA